MKRYPFILALCFGLCACGTPDPLRHSLEAAGENRAELEKVLEHYSQHPADSLKLKAARFLIANMPGKHSYDSPDIRRFYREADSVFQDTAIHDRYEYRLDTLLAKIDARQIEERPDLEHITASLLIENIDDAFVARERYPWCRRLSFEEFCEYVLPYRAGTTPLEEWRPLMRKRFGALVDSLVAAGAPDSVVCKAICAEYYTVIHYPQVFKPQYSPSSLLNIVVAPCTEWTNFSLYAVRTFGLPAVADFTPFWADRSMGHEWCVLLTPGEQYTFMMGDKEQRGHQDWFTMMGKVFRRTASIQQESLAMQHVGEQIPEQFNDPYLKDVSEYYFQPEDITVELEYAAPVPKKTAYIMVFNSQDWRPIYWGLIEKEKVTFKKMNKECMYMSAYYHEGRFYPASEPFYLDSTGRLHYLRPEPEQMECVSLKWKYSSRTTNEWCERIVGGKFQVANRPDFSDAEEVYVIDSVPEALYHDIPLRLSGKYRYFRYLAPKGSPGDLAELEIYDERDSLMEGEVIGDNTSFYIFGASDKYRVFDKNIASYFEAENREDAWVGMDFKSPVQISRFAYLPHNDDNFVRDNELYELFYWKKGWRSVGIQRGRRSQQALLYKVPANSLLRLTNHSVEKRDERVFVYKDGKQIWF